MVQGNQYNARAADVSYREMCVVDGAAPRHLFGAGYYVWWVRSLGRIHRLMYNRVAPMREAEHGKRESPNGTRVGMAGACQPVGRMVIPVRGQTSGEPPFRS